ncbi:hypothetical protein XENTR_v10015231 [Xenopus tropicalis]|nr:hypothetical protein XENTR_v10015231 [Xenopus tropicalis]
MDPILNDRIQFPSFYRTIPDEESEIDGIVEILKHFGWKWVGLIVSDDETGYRGRERISKELARIGGCLAFSAVLKHNSYIRISHENKIVQELEKTTANVIVLFLNKFVYDVTTLLGDANSFNEHGDPLGNFDIIKWFFLPNHYVARPKVGNIHASSNKTSIFINSSSDVWGPYFQTTPQSLCNEPCPPGYRKSKRQGAPSCCYDCVHCADGEMSNTSDAPSCFKCSEYQMSNKQRTVCIPKSVNYLSFEDTLGASLASIALVLFLTTSVVQGTFIKYWETPIVRANNQHLSCLLLISLMLCFLCTLLFIGRPTQICCLLRQVTFGIVFTISVSSVLAKTLTVIIAFNATKPGSKLKKYVGTQLAILLVLMCTLGKIGISVVWMASNPPFLEADTFSEMDTIILLCNEGSVAFFFCIIGYMGTLALLSFIAAFLAKDFPDRFNEAKNITFSMLGFCSVWGAFVPAYLSSKGSRMVAVEIFAILSSSAGLLACIFLPKCFIIFFRPEINTRETVVLKR